MVDALYEACRVLTPSGILLDVRPLIEPITVEVVGANQVVWAKTVEVFSEPADVVAADAAIRHALSQKWIVFESSLPFRFDIYCDNSAELNAYVESRKLQGADIPYDELEERRRDLGRKGQSARLRCRRPWMLSTYRSKSTLFVSSRELAPPSGV